MSSRLGLVLSAGGARAAYQVGVLRFLARKFPNFKPTIFSGISAGSINAAFLAQGEPTLPACEKLYSLWENILFEQVFKTNFKSLANMSVRLLYDLFISKVTHRLLFKSIFDASPLASSLLTHVHFWKITKAIRAGLTHGLAVSTTNYNEGSTTIFFDSPEEVQPWKREKRVAIRTPIRVRHIMASCSIPILFEPIRIGDFFYGDGALRFSFPLSPPIHLGATHVMALGIRCPTPEVRIPPPDEHPSLGFIAGTVLNSIFLDSLEADFETLNRLNQLEAKAHPHFRRVKSILLRPSRDLATVAREHYDEIPFHLRQFLRTTATETSDLADLVSYLLFSHGYLQALLKLGEEDAENQVNEVAEFLLE